NTRFEIALAHAESELEQERFAAARTSLEEARRLAEESSLLVASDWTPEFERVRERLDDAARRTTLAALESQWESQNDEALLVLAEGDALDLLPDEERAVWDDRVAEVRRRYALRAYYELMEQA